MMDMLSVLAVISVFAMVCHKVFLKQLGYPRKYIKRFKEIYDGLETKRTIAYVAGDVPGDIVFGASKDRPLLAIDFAIDITVKNTPDVETAVGSGLFFNDRLFTLIHATDGDDRLLNLLRDSETQVQDTFFREASIQTFDDILQTAEDHTVEHLIVPCYSEIPVTLSLALADLTDEYTGGTITFEADSVIVVGGVYGEGRLGFEQPFLYQHAEVLTAGRNELVSLTARKPFYGVLLVNSSQARAESDPVQLIDYLLIGLDMKDDHNEVNYLINRHTAARLYRGVPDGIEVLTDDKGHMNNLTAAVAVLGDETLDTTMKYVGLFTSLPGETARKGNRPVSLATT